MKKHIKIKDRILGSFNGLALGDAAGWPVEFNEAATPRNPIVKDLHASCRKRPDGSFEFTDDTQMTIATAEGLLLAQRHADETQSTPPYDMYVAEAYVDWCQNPVDGHRAPGGACQLGCENLSKVLDRPFADFTKCGKEGGGGCGVAMRSAPYGWMFGATPITSNKWAARHALFTHRSAMAQASGVAVATAVRMAMFVEDPFQIATAAARAAGTYDQRTMRMIYQAMYWATDEGKARVDAWEVFDKFRGWAGHEAVAASIYSFLFYPNDFEKAILLAVNSPGDSDSLGSITGAISGAYLGNDAIRQDWRDKVERKDHIRYLSEEMARRTLTPPMKTAPAK